MTFTKKFKLVVLSIDGGGIKGIVPAMILAEIERRTGKQIHQLFDLIAGTSTGGILSLGLTKPNKDKEAEFSAEKLVSLYTNEGKKIFKKREIPNLSLLKFLPLLDLPINLEELVGSKYTRKEKVQVIQKWFGETFLDKALTEVIITSYAINERIPILFTNNPHKEESKSKNFRRICSGYKMYNAAMATSAAPTFFKPYSPEFISTAKQKYFFIDGGVIANNPTSIAIIEAMKSYEIKMHKPINLEDILVVSLGTGIATESFSKETEKWGLIQWVKPLINIVFTGQSEIITYQMEHLLPEKHYYRFQFNCEKSNRINSQNTLLEKCYVNEDMDDVSEKNIEELKRAANQLIGEESSKLEDLCNVLNASLNTRDLLNQKAIA
jgi:patatin-like phospholipase/acyl hydrolase